jgi:bifunctional non-homologous end joining protein LigD
VSTPALQEELDDPLLRPDGFTVRDVAARLAERGDPFRALLATEQDLPPLG